MRKLVMLFLFLGFNSWAGKEVNIKVELSPAGSFEINSKRFKGSAKKAGEVFTTEGIKIKTTSLKTGLELRDEHMHKKLEAEKYPYIEILKGKAKGGRGVALVKIRNATEKVAFTYKEDGGEMKITMPLSLEKFKFTGINYAGVGVKDQIIIYASVPLKK